MVRMPCSASASARRGPTPLRYWTDSSRLAMGEFIASIIVGFIAMAYGLLYICRMLRFGPIYWCACLLGFALLTNGCGGRAVGKNMARDLIVSAHADALAKDDLQVLV